MPAPSGRPALFLDRDGVLNIDTGYPHRPADLRLTATAAEAVRVANATGWPAVVVTNQSGVARGKFGIADVEQFHAAIQAELARHGARIDAFYYCPFHPGGSVAAFRREHADRKPAPGMILRAIAHLGIDPTRSILIGDHARDIAAAAVAGVRGIRVETDLPNLADVVRRAIT